MTAEERARQEAANQAALAAAAVVAESYARELAGHRLNRRLQAEQDKAARLARALVRIDEQKRGRR